MRFNLLFIKNIRAGFDPGVGGCPAPRDSIPLKKGGAGRRIAFLPHFVIEQGFSFLEFIVVVAMISVLVGVAVSRFSLQVDAERAAMEHIVGTLRSAIGIKVADYLAKGNLSALRTLEKSNPMDRLAEVPKNYVGEVDDARTVVEEGKWYFD